MKVLITGAHFTPALAVIEELKKTDCEIVYIGRRTTGEGDKTLSVESQILPQLGIRYKTIITGRLQRLFNFYTIPSLLKIPIGFLQAVYFLLSERPDVVLSFGGYVGVPIVVVAWLFSIPIIVHEQTLVSGLANTISNFFADKVALSFDPELLEGKEMINMKEVVVTGNPLRVEILKNFPPTDAIKNFFNEAKSANLPVLLVTGGNQGSHIINKNMGDILENVLSKVFVIHQTGDSKYKDYEKLVEKSQELRKKNRYLVFKWLEARDMAYIMKNADLVVSRAGANTLMELAYLGVPTLVIPLPYLFRDEQNVNAKFFEKMGLVSVLPQSKLNNENLESKIFELLNNLEELKKNAKKVKQVVIPDAAKRLSLEVISLAKR